MVQVNEDKENNRAGVSASVFSIYTTPSVPQAAHLILLFPLDFPLDSSTS